MRQLLNYIQSCCFVVVLFLPLLLAIITPDLKISKSEQRPLITFPDIDISKNGIITFPAKFEEYYNDHYGLRDQFIVLYDLFHYRFFEKSPTPSVIVGNNNWLFYNSDGSLSDYVGINRINLKHLEQFRYTLEDRKEWLAERGIKYLFLPVPNKMMVYEEFLPARIKRNSGVTLYDKFINHMQSRSTFTDIVDSKKILLNGKRDKQVFFSTDTHWNSNGSFLVYQKVLSRLQKWFPDLEPISDKDIDRTVTRHYGDLAIIMHMQAYINEMVPEVHVKNSCSQKKDEKMLSFVNPDKNMAHKKQFLPETNGCPQKKLNALFLHDSFGYFLRPLLSQHFKKITFMHFADFNGMKDFIEQERPDVVIDQRVARKLVSALRNDESIENHILSKKMRTSSFSIIDCKRSLASIDKANFHDIQLVNDKEKTLLLAKGNDPFVIIPLQLKGQNQELIVHLKLTSPHNTVLQLYYSTTSSPDFSESRAVKKIIKKGYNDLLFRLPHPDINGKIRLDPAKLPGKYYLHSFLIKKEVSSS